jgi:hypothetical protein
MTFHAALAVIILAAMLFGGLAASLFCKGEL